MKCPYCEKEMISGTIYGDRYRMGWMPKNKKLILAIWMNKPIKLGEWYGFGRSRVDADYCYNCKKMIIDVKDKY
jgi:hypothetical protein